MQPSRFDRYRFFELLEWFIRLPVECLYKAFDQDGFLRGKNGAQIYQDFVFFQPDDYWRILGAQS